MHPENDSTMSESDSVATPEAPSSSPVAASGSRHPLVAVVFRIVVCLVVLAVGGALATLLTVTAPVPGTVDLSDRRLPVVAIVPGQEALARRWTGFGTMRPSTTAMVPSRVASTVIEVPERLEVGTPVREGEMLVRLDAADYRRQAEAAVERLAQVGAELDRLGTELAAAEDRKAIAAREAELAESDLQRVREARSRGAALPREIDAAEQQVLAARRGLVAIDELLESLPAKRRMLEAQRDQLESDRRLAESQVDRCEIVAPFDGVIAAVLVEVGEQVAPGAPVARIFDPRTIELPLRIPASARGRVEVGDEVVVKRTVSDEPIVASIVRIAPEDDAGSRTMTVFVELESEGGRVVPGLFVHGEVIESDRRPRTIVPRRSVVNQRVMLIEDDRIRFQPVRTSFPLNVDRPETGLADRQWLVLESLLPPDAMVVIDGSRDLEAGVAVEARPPVRSPGTAIPGEAGAP